MEINIGLSPDLRQFSLANRTKKRYNRTNETFLTYTVNGESVSRQVRNLGGGTLGLVSWNGGGSFNNVVYTNGVQPPATEDPVDPPATDDKPDNTDKPAEPSAPVMTAPSDDPAETPSKVVPSALLPILIGVGAVVVIGAVVAVVIVKKKK